MHLYERKIAVNLLVTAAIEREMRLGYIIA